MEAQSLPPAVAKELGSYEAPVTAGSKGNTGLFMYWRNSRGWIIIAPGWATEIEEYTMRDFQPLPKYGRFKLEEIPKHQRYTRILERGGAKEFPIDQIVALGWVDNPPFGLSFPQLEGIQLHRRTCPYCNKKIVRLEENVAQRDIDAHISIAHKEISQSQQLAQSIATALDKVKMPEGGGAPEVSQAMMEALTVLSQAVVETQVQNKLIMAKLGMMDEEKPQKKMK
jgi:hypothetical protein